MLYTVEPIGYVRSPFKEKFGIPRQPGLITAVDAWIEFVAPYNLPDTFIGLDAFSHVWVHFLFHQNASARWKPKVRPPRLGGNKKLGVFATRSSFRPNGIGLSVVELKEVIIDNNTVMLRIGCPDLLDGTPVIDIKPYIRYADAIPHATSSYAEAAPESKIKITFSDAASDALSKLETRLPNLKNLIKETISLDPRPAYQGNKHNDKAKEYGIRLYNVNIRWQIEGLEALIIAVDEHRL